MSYPRSKQSSNRPYPGLDCTMPVPIVPRTNEYQDLDRTRVSPTVSNPGTRISDQGFRPSQIFQILIRKTMQITRGFELPDKKNTFGKTLVGWGLVGPKPEFFRFVFFQSRTVKILFSGFLICPLFVSEVVRDVVCGVASFQFLRYTV